MKRNMVLYYMGVGTLVVLFTFGWAILKYGIGDILLYKPTPFFVGIMVLQLLAVSIYLYNKMELVPKVQTIEDKDKQRYFDEITTQAMSWSYTGSSNY